MGKRRQQVSFAPGQYVFPGGVYEAADADLAIQKPFQDPGLARSASRAIGALANTAIRETFEETGLLLAEKGDLPVIAHSSWRKFSEQGLAPIPSRLIYLGRAITPTYYPQRFHARFFAAPFENFLGELIEDGELLDLRWLSRDSSGEFPMLDVTEFMLEELERALKSQRRRTPLMSYRNNLTMIRYE